MHTEYSVISAQFLTLLLLDLRWQLNCETVIIIIISVTHYDDK